MGAMTKQREYVEQRVNVPIHKFSDFDSFLKTGCQNVWATFRACHLTANIILSTDFKLKKGDDDQALEVHEFMKFMSNPNPHDSWEEMIYMWTFHLKLTGNAYWLKDELDGKNKPRALYPLLPHLMSIVPSRLDKVSHYLYKVNGEEIRFEREQIIHWKRPNPCSLYYGMGDIEPSQSLYNNFINKDRYEEAFLKHGAMPSGVLTYKGSEEAPVDRTDMDDKEWGKLKDWWHAEYGGHKNAGRTAFLTGEWEYTKLGLTQSEMETLESSKWSVEQIFINHGVPLSIAGVQKAANFATAKIDEINFRKMEIVPLLDLFVGKLNSSDVLVKLYDDKLVLKYELSGLIDVEQKWKDIEGLVKNGGMTMNEAREHLGFPKDANVLLDQYFMDKGRTPIELAGIEAPDELGLRMLHARAGDHTHSTKP